MKILFISRKFPPITGGMENYAYNLHDQFSAHHEVTNIILKKSQLHLLWFFPWCLIYGSFLIMFRKVDLIYVGDGVLSPIAYWFQKISKKKVLITIYGLDVIYNKYYYQKLIKFFLPKINNIIAISQATKDKALDLGVSETNCKVIPVGVVIPDDNLKTNSIDIYNKIKERFNIDIRGKKVLFTLGRLVKRKGVRWFVNKVVPSLSNNYIYLIAGNGPEYENIKSAIIKCNVQNNVHLLGKVSDKEKKLLFSAAKAFISPNITITGDMEGFGIVNLEAGVYSIPVVASNIEGVKDAVIDKVTGYLVKEKCPNSFLKAIHSLNKIDSKSVRNIIIKKYSWKNIYFSYMEFINDIK